MEQKHSGQDDLGNVDDHTRTLDLGTERLTGCDRQLPGPRLNGLRDFPLARGDTFGFHNG